MPQPKIPAASGVAAVLAVKAGNQSAEQLALATRFVLQELNRAAPGRSVEVRVPPYGAVQIIEGPGHTRGTPANVIELTPKKLVDLATGDLEWDEALNTGEVIASGVRADLSKLFPLELEAK